MANTVRVYIIRHGETEANKTGIIQGQLDTKLNDEGIKQVEKVGNALKHAQLGVAYTSDLSRAVQTAEEIVRHHPGVVLNKQAALRERNMGELQGRRVGTQLGKMATGLEPRYELIRRAATWWNEIVNPFVADTAGETGLREDILVVSHGGWIHALTQAMLDGDHDLKVTAAEGVAVGGKCYNTSITIVEVDRESLSGLIVKYADSSHLTEPVVQDNADIIEQ